MVDTNKLKGKIAENGLSATALANRIGVTKETLSKKVQGKTYFNTFEMEKIREHLHLSDEDFMSIFFADYVT